MTIQRFDTLESTNKYCELLDLDMVEEFLVVVANSQTAGIGQQGNHWHSAPKQNLTFSLVLHPSFLLPTAQFRLTQAFSLSLRDSIQQFIPQHEVKIKWPNDIYVGMRKICGILTTTHVSRGVMTNAICGIGLNVNETEFPEWVPYPTSLASETGKTFDLDAVLNDILNHIQTRYLQLKKLSSDSKWLHNLEEEYLIHLLNNGQWANYRYHGTSVRGKILGVSEYGHLIVKLEDQQTVQCAMKEIELVRG